MNKNTRTALIVASCALAFFAGFIAKAWLFGL
ncbi:cytochrome oxidase small assembly protein [Chitinivorax sp. PXF-14]